MNIYQQYISKILCIGTTEWIIKVLDIIKSNNGIEWQRLYRSKEILDPENNTKLIVMKYLNVLDLSNDFVAHTQNL
jgi:hypothetical protein